ncbi:MAG: Crp/Fnr family transcriptional regulator [Thiotrichales bacterium]|nr:Crp/Fnr family transcriptional regulator [Thiotrichales bacterium]
MVNVLDLVKDEPGIIKYSSGDVIFDEGDYGDHMYVLVEGSVDISVADKVMLTAGPGEIIGEMALIESNPRSARAVAASDCSLISVDRKRFAELVQQTPRFSIYVMRVLADRLRRMNDLLRE